jgi:hypothetical protein
MTPFRFRLEKVLAWRRMQLSCEEAKYQQRMAELRELECERARVEAAGIRTELEVRAWSPLAGCDLESLANFRQHVVSQEKRLARRREEAYQRVETQQKVMIEARRRCQLLERLHERRLAEWQAAADNELEQLAAEFHLAGLSRRN